MGAGKSAKPGERRKRSEDRTWDTFTCKEKQNTERREK